MIMYSCCSLGIFYFILKPLQVIGPLLTGIMVLLESVWCCCRREAVYLGIEGDLYLCILWLQTKIPVRTTTSPCLDSMGKWLVKRELGVRRLIALSTLLQTRKSDVFAKKVKVAFKVGVLSEACLAEGTSMSQTPLLAAIRISWMEVAIKTMRLRLPP